MSKVIRGHHCDPAPPEAILSPSPSKTQTQPPKSTYLLHLSAGGMHIKGGVERGWQWVADAHQFLLIY